MKSIILGDNRFAPFDPELLRSIAAQIEAVFPQQAGTLRATARCQEGEVDKRRTRAPRLRGGSR